MCDGVKIILNRYYEHFNNDIFFNISDFEGLKYKLYIPFNK